MYICNEMMHKTCFLDSTFSKKANKTSFMIDEVLQKVVMCLVTKNTFKTLVKIINIVLELS